MRRKDNKSANTTSLFAFLRTFGGWVMVWYTLILPFSLNADQLTHEFKSPSFSGVGTSSHYLTIDEQEKSRRDEIAEEIEQALKEAEREAENTTLAKFLRNLESRIYSQLSRDIAESLFDSEKGGIGGEFELEGSTIRFLNDGINITLTVTDEDGNITEIIIPIGIFGVCTAECGI